MTESPGSPLSSIASDEMSDREDLKHPFSPSASTLPPSKRRRTGVASWDRNTPLSTAFQEDLPPTSPSTSISSDTSGDIPNSPTLLALIGGSQDDDYSGQGNDQVTVCRWEGCNVGDLGNMDDLVQHIHNDHVGNRQKRYSCEWSDCPRKGQTHASGYALRAHMRSHTREKPFYCALPECDRSFTRSDALAKHMRTVHETEALRPSDPVPKGHNVPASAMGTPAGTPVSKLQRIRLKLSQPKDEADRLSEIANDDAVVAEDLEELELPEFGPEIEFDEHELQLRPYDLYRLLRRQIHWAEKEGQELKEEWEKIRPKRKQAWLEKETIFDDVIDAELRLFSAIVATEGLPAESGNAPNGVQKAEQGQHVAVAEAEASLSRDSMSIPP
ncbi:pyridoxal reductase [Aspergillus lentulus]|uniref:Pyridoxal reductase n=1 Tax=Aspergillus lentulus TaxID=293939 RepID=A0ABQ1A3A1_ASPLE|nr:pyridoxal reductase [Aspergillus lentulus]GFF44261.1 pyridoxal reductase [Aspergillus lentulus]GFF53028.1 pyridoxal reductase [Aspergillus lentulus]GFF72516.1 pyridoxal reductase [Aspergillus lentulus]GFF94446.1 pyridoxal reductase [Aspergillus lentulus]GFG08140.1 pyridoxal reductase [Aspergillus lentulus]